jgi:hypothetical protein
VQVGYAVKARSSREARLPPLTVDWNTGLKEPAMSGTARKRNVPYRQLRPGHEEVIMNRLRRICHSLASLPRRADVLLAAAAAVPAVLATPPPRPPGWNKHPPLPAHTHLAGTAGMPSWQTALIAAALLVAALAVTGYRIRAARQRATASAG